MSFMPTGAAVNDALPAGLLSAAGVLAAVAALRHRTGRGPQGCRQRTAMTYRPLLLGAAAAVSLSMVLLSGGEGFAAVDIHQAVVAQQVQRQKLVAAEERLRNDLNAKAARLKAQLRAIEKAGGEQQQSYADEQKKLKQLERLMQKVQAADQESKEADQ